jgi:cytochrome c556
MQTAPRRESAFLRTRRIRSSACGGCEQPGEIELMSSKSRAAGRAILVMAAVMTLIDTADTAIGQTPPPPAPSPAKRAVDERKAIYTLIGSNFKPVGEVLQGHVPYDATELRKRTTRVAFLAGLAGEAFPEVSNAGLPATRAKAEIWSSRAEFDRRLADFAAHAQSLAQVVARGGSSGDEFKAAAGALAQDCKGCHENFREK